MKEQIILTLVYLRHLNTFQLLGIQFGVSESTANDTLANISRPYFVVDTS
ncbi:transposase family protein [Nostoc sp. CHAB 5834]|nr:transposase family protein [Nostoc sp. CHAB 5834]